MNERHAGRAPARDRRRARALGPCAGRRVSLPRSWLLLCALHGVASMLLWWARADLVDVMTWHAEGWQHQPWTLWTSAWVHLGTPHLIGNQLALGALTAFGWMARPCRRRISRPSPRGIPAGR